MKREVEPINTYQFKIKLHRMLWWSRVGVLWCFILEIIVIDRLYHFFQGKQLFLMAGSLVALYFCFAVVLWFAWKKPATTEIKNSEKSNDTIIKTEILFSRIKSVSTFLWFYFKLLALFSLFFLSDFNNGLTTTLKLSTMVDALFLLIGIYFVFKINDYIQEVTISIK